MVEGDEPAKVAAKGHHMFNNVLGDKNLYLRVKFTF